jgi:hypothetical protein
VPLVRVSFRRFISDKEHGYNILSQKVEGAGSMPSSHKKPYKELDLLALNEVDDFLFILRLTQPQPITSYRR